jgi:hypothetical protein
MCSHINKQVNWACLDSLLSKFSSKTNCSSIVAQTRCNWWYSWCLNRGDIKTGAVLLEHLLVGDERRQEPWSLWLSSSLMGAHEKKFVCCMQYSMAQSLSLDKNDCLQLTATPRHYWLSIPQHPLTLLVCSLSVAWIRKRYYCYHWVAAM